ncbi:MAG: hypothetical protein LBB42_05420 [Coriobacteriales bacterium]|jgi:hypothetical protein|nr:hypothetical protein [Coriobacteriales bacterium]
MTDYPTIEVFSYLDDAPSQAIELRRRTAKENAPERAFGQRLLRTSICYADMKELEQAKTKKKLVRFAERFSGELYFGECLTINTAEKESLDIKSDVTQSIACFRNSIITAMHLFMALKSSSDSFYSVSGEGEGDYNFPTYINTYFDQFGNECFKAELVLPISGLVYREYLRFGCQRANSHEIGCTKCDVQFHEHTKEWVLTIATGEYRYIPEEIKECYARLLDVLSEVHMNDISTTTEFGIPRQKTNSIVSSLWYCMTASFRSGRIAICQAPKCGLPFIAQNERGEPRLYCCSACSKRAYRDRKL